MPAVAKTDTAVDQRQDDAHDAENAEHLSRVLHDERPQLREGGADAAIVGRHDHPHQVVHQVERG